MLELFMKLLPEYYTMVVKQSEVIVWVNLRLRRVHDILIGIDVL